MLFVGEVLALKFVVPTTLHTAPLVKAFVEVSNEYCKDGNRALRTSTVPFERIEAILAIAALVLAAVLTQLPGFTAAVLLWLLVSAFVGLEGNALRIAALRRRGWQEWGVVEAANLDDADAHYAVETVDAEAAADQFSALPSPPSANSCARPVAGDPVGLLLNPGR